MTNLFFTPYDKFMTLGVNSLSDVELLAIIIRSGTKEMDALELADFLLASHDDKSRIVGLLNTSFEELLSYKGIGKVKAMCIECIIELSKRMYKQSRRELLSFAKPDSIADYYMEQLRHLEQECVYLLLLDVKCNLLKEIQLTSGTINSSIVSPREIFINALNYKASGIVLLHNHPSGDSTPSKMDFSITTKIKEAGALIDIPLFDHIIIGDMNFYSFKSMGFI